MKSDEPDMENIPNVNPKIYMLGYGRYFIVNAFIILLIHTIAWSLSLIFSIVKKYTENRVLKIVANFFNYNFVIIVFFMGANELTMLAFY